MGLFSIFVQVLSLAIIDFSELYEHELETNESKDFVKLKLV